VPGEGRWQPGTVIVQEEYWRHQLVTVRPVTVVEDSERVLALFSHFGGPYRSGAMRGRQRIPLEERVRVYLSDQQPELRDEVSRWNALTLTPPSAGHSVWLFWDGDWRLTNWHVNLQAPLIRTPRGVIVRDYLLDLVLIPGLHWAWKDEDEFKALCERGVFSRSEEAAIRAEGERAIQAIERREWPFDARWLDWRPGPEWPVPDIREHWDQTVFPFPLLAGSPAS